MSERPSPIEFMKQTAEAGRLKENSRRSEEITKKLVENSGIFGGQIEEEKSHAVCQEVFDVFGAKYTSIKNMEEIINNPNAFDSQKTKTRENLEVLSNSAFKAINFSFKDYPEGLVTSQLRPEEIDDFFPEEMKGLGKYVVETDKKATEDDKKAIFEMDFSKKEEKNENFGETLNAINKILENVGVSKEAYEKAQKGDFSGFKPRIIKNDNGEDENAGYERAWIVTPEKAAEAFKFMAYDLRWSTWTPPEWFNKLSEDEQYRIEMMVMVNDGAATLSYAGKEIDKAVGNKIYFSFDNEKFTALFDDDFKLAMSKMFHDLCEFKPDQNGLDCLCYREDRQGGFKLTKEVTKKIEHIRDYKENLAVFIAENNGRWETYKKDDDKNEHKKGDFVLDKKGNKVPDYMCKMDAYTVWNLFYMFGDSSLADRTRSLPTYGGIISDCLRTLNPEYKALKKWKIKEGRQVVDEKESLFDAEYFGGPMADYVNTVSQMEQDLGRPIDGPETLRQKIVNGKLPIFANKTVFGFFDFVSSGYLYSATEKNSNGEPKTFKDMGEKTTLAKVLYNYGEFNSKTGKFEKSPTAKDFNFGDKQVDFWNLFRDQQETAVLAYKYMTGKADVRDLKTWSRDFKDKLGMLNGVKINGEPAFSYASRPDFWANAILGSLGIDMNRLSTNSIRVDKSSVKESASLAYNKFVYDLLFDELKLSNKNVNLAAVMQYMGVDFKPGENVNGDGLILFRNASVERDLKKRTDALSREWGRSSEFSVIPPNMQTIVNEASKVYGNGDDFDRLKIYFNQAIKLRDPIYAERLLEQLKKLPGSSIKK